MSHLLHLDSSLRTDGSRSRKLSAHYANRWRAKNPDGTITYRDLRVIAAQLRGLSPGLVSPGQMTYDLRRLRTHALIERVPHTHRYQVTDHGLHTAMFLTRIHDRLIPTGLAHLAEQSTPGPLRTAATAYQNPIDNLTNATGLAA